MLTASSSMISTNEILQCMNIIACLMAPIFVLAATFIQCKKGKKDPPAAPAPSKSKMGAPPAAPAPPAAGGAAPPPAAPAAAAAPVAADKPAADGAKVNRYC